MRPEARAALLVLGLRASPGAAQEHVSCAECAVPAVETMASSKDGYTTYRLNVALGGVATNIYTIFGDSYDVMSIPAAFQVPAPFGTDLGGTNPAFWSFNADCEFDSWLTVGPTDGDSSGAISTIGIYFYFQ